MVTFATLMSLILMTNTVSLPQEFPTDAEHPTSLIQIEILDNSYLGAADTSSLRVLLPLALDMIKDYEKWVPKPYNDASRYCTIGYGHLVAKRPCEDAITALLEYDNPLDAVAGLKLLDSDSAAARSAVQVLVKSSLNDEQFGALTSFAFNVGAANFAKSTLLKYVNNEEYEGAYREFARWVRSKGATLPGLISRRSCEAALFAGKASYRQDGKFYRADCESLGAAPQVDNLIDIEKGE